MSLESNTMASGEWSFSATPAEQLLSFYYTFFHSAHPCVLPQSSLERRSANDPPALQPLLLVMQYIGSLFTSSIPSQPLEDSVLRSLASYREKKIPITGYLVQALVLYAIAVYWCDDIPRGLSLLDESIDLATSLGMHLQGYAVQHGEGDPILEESWRRTWWQVYITDAHIAGSTHTFPFRTSSIKMTADLPCEEQCYESGVSRSLLSNPIHPGFLLYSG
jgi:hypothetical protein